MKVNTEISENKTSVPVVLWMYEGEGLSALTDVGRHEGLREFHTLAWKVVVKRIPK